MSLVKIFDTAVLLILCVMIVGVFALPEPEVRKSNCPCTCSSKGEIQR